MRVVKRDGSISPMLFDKVAQRIQRLCDGLEVSADLIAQKSFGDMYDMIQTSKIDDISADIACHMATKHSDYETLASRILVSNIQKNCPTKFSHAMSALQLKGSVTSELVLSAVDAFIVPERDYLLGYFALKTLQKGYLNPGETPQYMFMRVAVGIHGSDLKAIRESYDLMSQKFFTHATPTLFNAGTPRPQMSSCFLISVEDSIEGIYDTLKKCAHISKWSGGIGMHVSSIRSAGCEIKGTRGKTDGIIPMLRVFNATARYVNQGSKRKGAIAIYLEPWHADVMEFLELRLNQGDEESRCRDLFTALWIPDLFMQKVEKNETWHLMSPDESPGLNNVYGEAFNEKYRQYVAQGRFKKIVQARDVWEAILKSQVETGTPYMLYKDAVNEKSNQKNIGVIKSSNLCVAPETKILTRTGNTPISLLCNQTVEVWNGHEWSSVQVKMTSPFSSLMQVEIDSTILIDCTPEHTFYTGRGKLAAGDLRPGDSICHWVGPDGCFNAQRVTNIISASKHKRISETYCFNEPLHHMGVFNGVLAGNCTEIVEYSDESETACCNLASLSLPAFVTDGKFNFEKLHEVTQVATRNLNKVIDRNYYPTVETRKSNLRHRPIALGVQGLADVFMLLNLPFDSTKARELNKQIFETIYHASLTASCALARKDGRYETFNGSPASEGKLQFDLWNKLPEENWDWHELRQNILMYGLRNSLLVAPMPTASTASILGNNEAFEPYTTNIYLRRTLAGEFTMLNPHLVKALTKLGKWTPEIKTQIIRDGGSVQGLAIPAEVKKVFRTVWEISQKSLLEMSADRGIYIDQSQSLNIFMEDPSSAKLSSMHMAGWKLGLKTGMYYLRTRSKVAPVQVTVPVLACRRDNPECESCSG